MPDRITALDAVVFLDELVLLAVFAVAGAGLGDSVALHVVLAILLPVAAAVFWGRWLAPRASGRLPRAPRFAAKIVLFTLATALLGAAGHVVWAVVFWAGSVIVLGLAERAAPAVQISGAASTGR